MKLVKIHKDSSNGNIVRVTISLRSLLFKHINGISLEACKKDLENILSTYPECKSFVLDFSGNSFFRRFFRAVAEVMQEHPEIAWECRYDESVNSGAGVKKAFERIQEYIEKCTVRVAFGTELVDALYDAEDPEETIKEYEEGDTLAGGLTALRFSTEREKNAYLRGLSYMDGWHKYSVIDEEFPQVAKKISPELF